MFADLHFTVMFVDFFEVILIMFNDLYFYLVKRRVLSTNG